MGTPGPDLFAPPGPGPRHADRVETAASPWPGPRSLRSTRRPRLRPQGLSPSPYHLALSVASAAQALGPESEDSTESTWHITCAELAAGA
jgi:hypothetical protein